MPANPTAPPQDPRLPLALVYLRALADARLGYEWGGALPVTAGHYGTDCSGAVCAALAAAGIVPEGYDATASALAYHCAPVDLSDVRPGDLLFYGKGRVSHVMMADEGTNAIGAQGGGEDTTTPEKARAADARVKVVARDYRPDLITAGRWRAA
jgi:cell wall-associated NlpC family hydrolase